MSSSVQKKSIVERFLGPLIPIGLASFGVWLLVSGRYVFRPGRSNGELVLLAPDAHLIGVFFLFLAALLVAFGVGGRKEKWFFWVGALGSTVTIVIESTRQLLGLAVYGQ